MFKNRLISLVCGLMAFQAPLATMSGESATPAQSRGNDKIDLSIHRDNNCDGRPLEWTQSASIATGERVTICFTPNSSAYIYIMNESEDGTYLVYPQAIDQLGAIRARQIYAFEILGKPGPETFTFFITHNPIAHFDDAIRGGRLRLSRSRLLHGNGSEAALSRNKTIAREHADQLGEDETELRLIDSARLDLLVKDWLDVLNSLRESSTRRERVRLNSVVSNISKGNDSGVWYIPPDKAMIVEFSYYHRSQ